MKRVADFEDNPTEVPAKKRKSASDVEVNRIEGTSLAHLYHVSFLLCLLFARLAQVNEC
jgi:hypothetical protein